MGRKKYALIMAGGTGVRMGFQTPKQFLELDGKPILRHTVEKFLSLPFDVEIVIVLADDMKEYWKEYCRSTGFIEHYCLPSSGMTRFHSVKNGLEYIPDGAIVAVHDGVRPFVTKEFLVKMFEKGESSPAVVPGISPVETVREVTGSESYLLNRENLLLIQTPQVFHSEILKEAYTQPYNPKFTDDASVVEAYGCKVEYTEGLRYNIKITTPEDLSVAERLL
ncbi:MAG: 2-C-methyl-D-erythritol 4-phosphate cytidylyltransferase [Bacteroidales bacterium]|nr:2-C-methyl-D-erythritol 4-phosphate cytidylyltransferase [Bacteroidales bacterium]